LSATWCSAPPSYHERLDADLTHGIIKPVVAQHHDRPTEHLGGLASLARSCCETALRDGDPDPPEELFALVLVEVHAARQAIEDAPPDGGATVRGSRRPVRA